jgi:2-deoxy-D-gluconate 3-dehydrogenase
MIIDLFKLDGRKAIVTGGARGIGRAYCEALHEAGAEVLIIDLLEDAKETAKEIASDKGAAVHYVIGDLSDRSELKKLFEESLEKLGGRLDILVNNAGINRVGPTLGYELENWDRIIAINLTSVFLLCQLALEVMVAQGKGKIINVSSMVGMTGGVNCAPYSASKGAIQIMTKTLSNEFAPKGININAIAPGYIATKLNNYCGYSEERQKHLLGRIPKGGWGNPEQLKGGLLFLASDASDYVTGVILPIDGGFLGR